MLSRLHILSSHIAYVSVGTAEGDKHFVIEMYEENQQLGHAAVDGLFKQFTHIQQVFYVQLL